MRTRTKLGIGLISFAIILGTILGALVSDDELQANGSVDILLIYPGQIIEHTQGSALGGYSYDLAYMFEATGPNVTLNIVIADVSTYSGAYSYLGTVELGIGDTFMIGNIIYVYEGLTGHFFRFERVPGSSE